jgi:hypothetical protein
MQMLAEVLIRKAALAWIHQIFHALIFFFGPAPIIVDAGTIHLQPRMILRMIVTIVSIVAVLPISSMIPISHFECSFVILQLRSPLVRSRE